MPNINLTTNTIRAMWTGWGERKNGFCLAAFIILDCLDSVAIRAQDLETINVLEHIPPISSGGPEGQSGTMDGSESADMVNLENSKILNPASLAFSAKPIQNLFPNLIHAIHHVGIVSWHAPYTQARFVCLVCQEGPLPDGHLRMYPDAMLIDGRPDHLPGGGIAMGGHERSDNPQVPEPRMEDLTAPRARHILADIAFDGITKETDGREEPILPIDRGMEEIRLGSRPRSSYHARVHRITSFIAGLEASGKE